MVFLLTVLSGQIRVNAAKTAVDTANVKHSINPFDEIAIEEAVRLKEGAKAAEVPRSCYETLKTAQPVQFNPGHRRQLRTRQEQRGPPPGPCPWCRSCHPRQGTLVGPSWQCSNRG